MILFGTIMGLCLYFGSLIVILIDMIRIALEKTTIKLTKLISLPLMVVGFILAFVSLNSAVPYQYTQELFLPPTVVLLIGLYFLLFANKSHKTNMLRLKPIIYEFSIVFVSFATIFIIFAIDLLTSEIRSMVIMLLTLVSLILFLVLSFYYIIKLRKYFNKI